MNTLGTPYRVKFSGGPQDGCFLDAEVPLGKKVAAPGRPWSESVESPNTVCRATGKPARTLRIRKAECVAEYWLDHAEYRVENDLPQVVFHYHFHPARDAIRPRRVQTAGRLWKLRPRYWLSMQAARLNQWLLTPVDYPFDVRRIGR